MIERYTSVESLQARLRSERESGSRVGWVGTSGDLHQGHLSLVRRSAVENDLTIMFWGGSGRFDWADGEVAHQRDYGRDAQLAADAGLDAIFVPDASDLFPSEPLTKVAVPSMSVDVPELEDPAHLDLIALVMCKLFNIFGESRSYFGEKDWQQLAMFSRLADDLRFPVEVIGCPTVREPDGLAMSSRNSRLSPEERAAAPALYEALCLARSAIDDGERSPTKLRDIVRERVERDAELVYFDIVRAEDIALVDPLVGEVRLLASIGFDSIRLVDNIGVTVAE